jgi:hypothetical protein
MEFPFYAASVEIIIVAFPHPRPHARHIQNEGAHGLLGRTWCP